MRLGGYRFTSPSVELWVNRFPAASPYFSGEHYGSLTWDGSVRQMANAEAVRQQLAQAHAGTYVLQVGDPDRSRSVGKFTQSLAAAAKGHDQFCRHADHSHYCHTPPACGY